MSIEIPDAAVEAATHGENYDDHMPDTWREVIRESLEAALPHLRAAILADLRVLIDSHVERLERTAAATDDYGQRRRLEEFIPGLTLARSYIGAMEGNQT
ncbi:hypothetical protein KIH74_22645 [Kineosporia sp. J2-2]|uniref:Uncharacterized protein n=1 Tax=Kineosporia corallincola TaxID=2835133 RepID=A0ABS5TKY8_9ACTN|nr:hypothetical protein [Kineosporia corallincola]MBT0771757.1 hypothetical protein [Kineosporia corallincola]